MIPKNSLMRMGIAPSHGLAVSCDRNGWGGDRMWSWRRDRRNWRLPVQYWVGWNDQRHQTLRGNEGCKLTALPLVYQIDIMEWWRTQDENDKIPHWTRTCRLVLPVQPSSSAAERVFSLLNNAFNSQQESSFLRGLFTTLSCYSTIIERFCNQCLFWTVNFFEKNRHNGKKTGWKKKYISNSHLNVKS